MLRFMWMVFALVLITGCNQGEQKRKLTPEELSLVAELKSQGKAIESDIKEANSELARYSSGLIPTLIQSRVEVLKVNRDLVAQRIMAIEFGAPMTVSVDKVEPDPALLTEIEAEMSSLQAEIDKNRQEASRYSGGLILAMKLSTIATQEQSMAMLQSKYLTAKYGISFQPAEIVPQQVSAAGEPGDVRIEEPNDTITEIEPPTVAPVKEKRPPADGPFGVKMGLSRSDIEEMIGGKLQKISDTPDFYASSTAPKTSSAASSYIYRIGNVTGLCMVKGVSSDIATNGYGLQLKSDYKELKGLLSEKYGQPDETDMLLPGSIWDDADEWMMALRKKDRYLLSHWDGDEMTLPNDLGSIALSVGAQTSSKGYLLIEYEFTNYDDCEAEAGATEKDSL